MSSLSLETQGPATAREKVVSEKSNQPVSLSDTDLLSLFAVEPKQAWQIFTGKYSELVFSTLQRLGFDYDEAMDRFVYIFEKLSEQNFRRLRTIRHAGSYGEITPWLVTVVQHLSISWLRSVDGRKRIFKSIANLSKHDQRVFELYYWKGCLPSIIVEQMNQEGTAIELAEVLGSLERIFSLISEKKRWRLVSNLLKTSRKVSLDAVDSDLGFSWQPVDPASTPEEGSIENEARARMQHALQTLAPEEQLMVQLRYMEGSSLKQLSVIFRTTEKVIQERMRSALHVMRQKLES